MLTRCPRTSSPDPACRCPFSARISPVSVSCLRALHRTARVHIAGRPEPQPRAHAHAATHRPLPRSSAPFNRRSNSQRSAAQHATRPDPHVSIGAQIVACRASAGWREASAGVSRACLLVACGDGLAGKPDPQVASPEHPAIHTQRHPLPAHRHHPRTLPNHQTEDRCLQSVPVSRAAVHAHAPVVASLR